MTLFIDLNEVLFDSYDTIVIIQLMTVLYHLLMTLFIDFFMCRHCWWHFHMYVGDTYIVLMTLSYILVYIV